MWVWLWEGMGLSEAEQAFCVLERSNGAKSPSELKLHGAYSYPLIPRVLGPLEAKETRRHG